MRNLISIVAGAVVGYMVFKVRKSLKTKKAENASECVKERRGDVEDV